MKKTIVAFCILYANITLAQTWIPGSTYFNSNTYVEYIFGNMPLIISAPHGGTIAPSTIPDRTATICGTSSVTTVTDSNTDDLARALDTSLRNLLGCRPHTIICRLDRIKIDMNREINEATCGNTIAQTTWYNYHAYIDTARKYILAKYGRGLFIDLHGHGHTKQRLEIGYLLTDSELRSSDTYLNSNSAVNNSSIKKLIGNNLGNVNHVELLKGATAFGTMMANIGYPSVPSQQDPAPLSTDEYFNGGYNTARWGSRDSGLIDGFQIETNFTGVRNSTANIKKFADSLAKVIKKYIETHILTPAQLAQCQATTGVFNLSQGLQRGLFSFYPNPVTTGNINIQLNKNYQKIILKLFDNKGSIIIQQSFLNSQQIKLSLPKQLKGLFLLEIQTDKAWEVQKILINN
jgi:hypothetical protein